MHQLQRTEIYSASQKALHGGHEAVNKSRDILDQPLNLPPIGNDPVSNYHYRYSRVTRFV